MDMNARRLFVIFGLLCLLNCFHVSQAAGQAPGSPGIPVLGSLFDQRWFAAGSAGLKDSWADASIDLGWLTTPSRIHVGYDGLVLPGSCISSFFVYPLGGLQVGASVPIRMAGALPLRVYGSYLIPHNPSADQELTWTHDPPGIREWRRSNSQWFKVGGEVLYPAAGQMALVGGFRWESLLSNFSDPNPDYIFTISSLQAQTTLQVYTPYVGVLLRTSSSPEGLTAKLVGFPYLFASIEHLNVCNNAGVPFAHTGNQSTNTGFFIEASAEYRTRLSSGVEAVGFIDWNVYHGHCDMTIERHEGGATPITTAGTVAWSHDISYLVLGGKIQMSWNLPF
jgi:hypothetical protein